MHKNIAWVLVLAACGPREVVTIVDGPCADAGVEDARVEDGGVEDGGVALADAGVEDGGIADGGAEPFDGCVEGFVPDGAYCLGWVRASSPQTCLDGAATLVQTDLIWPWTDHEVLAIKCPDELLQLYRPGEDRWERMRDVTATAIEPLVFPIGPDSPSIGPAAMLPDGTIVGVAGSVHAAPPFATWILDPGATTWRRSIDAPTVWVHGAGTVDDNNLLFVGYESYLFVRMPRL